LMYTTLTDATTRLEFHYRKRNFGRLDTVVTSLPFNDGRTTTASRSAYAVNITRTYTGSELVAPAPNALYIQAAPGTYAQLTIPGLSAVNNRIIHRAELIIEQIPGNPLVDGIMYSPNYLYIDNYDTGASFRPIPYDLTRGGGYGFYPGIANIDFDYFGGFLRRKTDAFGNGIDYYNFNITRYVQGIITRGERNLPLRLYAPFVLDYSKRIGSLVGIDAFRNSVAFGRIKIGNGNNPNYRLRLRLVYSRI
jgi:hypothetical protein